MRLIIVLFAFFMTTLSLFAQEEQQREYLMPAVQLNLEGYMDFFKTNIDNKLNLKTRSKYKITCDFDIIGVVYADKDNIKMYDVIDEYTEENDLKSVFIKTKHETYTYIRLYKENGETVDMTVSVNARFPEDETIPLGQCTLYPT